MKKLLLLFILFCSCTVIAQERSYHLDIRAKQAFGLTKWHDEPHVRDFIRNPNSTDFQIALYKMAYKKWGAFFDLSLCLYSYNAESTDPLYSFSPSNIENYYITERARSCDQSNIGNIGGKVTLGIFHKFNIGKWEIVPSLGYGRDEVNSPYFSYQLKEKDTNTMYVEEYYWFDNKSKQEGQKIKMFDIVSAQIQSYHKIGKYRMNFGVEFRHFLNKANFHSTITDYYDGSIINRDCIKGNLMKSLNFNIGISIL